MREKVIFFEVQGGSDKGADGYRPDTLPMVEALKIRGYDAEVIFFDSARKEQIFNYVSEHALAYVSRINPGNLKDEALYFDMLRELCATGVMGMPHPDAMIKYGAKDALVHLTDTPFVANDTYAYYTIAQFKEQFPQSLATGERVLKQNRGSTGEGIWRVAIEQPTTTTPLPLTTRIKCTEAKDNHVEYFDIGDFMTFCEQYIVGDNGMLVDMPFLSRIAEGEVRLLMLGDRPINVVHKKPATHADAFSATLFSGAHYRYDSPDDWRDLIDTFLDALPGIMARLGNYDLPLIWTADFILDTDDFGNDTYMLGEINCSCVGFTSQLELASDVAETIIHMLKKDVEIIA